MHSRDEFEKYVKAIGKKFKDLRLKMGKDIPTVATESGFLGNEIDNIEQGESSQYELKKLYDLCAYYGVEAIEFLDA
jgi:transcriptional regulator with XRE-family HTH domain